MYGIPRDATWELDHREREHLSSLARALMKIEFRTQANIIGALFSSEHSQEDPGEILEELGRHNVRDGA